MATPIRPRSLATFLVSLSFVSAIPLDARDSSPAPAPEIHGIVREAAEVEQSAAEALFASADAAIWFPDLRRLRWLDSSPTTAAASSELAAPASTTVASFLQDLERDFGGYRSRSYGHYLLKLPVRSEVLQAARTATSAATPAATSLTDSFESGLSQWTLANNTNGDYDFAVMGCKVHAGSWSADAVRGGYKGMYLACWDGYPASVTTQIKHSTCESIGGASQAWLDFYFTADMDNSDRLAAMYVGSDGYAYGYEFYGNWSGWFHIVLNLRQWYFLGDLTTLTCPKALFQFKSDASATAGTGTQVDDVTVRTDAPAFLSCSIAATPSSGSAPLTVSFAPTISGSSGGETFDWRFGDAAAASSTSRTPAFTYTTAGEYWPRLRVIDGNGTRGYAQVRIQVSSAGACSVSCTATAPSTATAGAAATFAASATAAGCSGNPAYLWTFGDGQTSAQQSPSHTYATAGTYSWTLTVTAGSSSCTKSGSIAVAADNRTLRRRAISPPSPAAGTVVQPSSAPQTFTSGDVSVTIPGGLLTAPKSLSMTKLASAPAAPFTPLALGAAYNVALGDLHALAQPLVVKMHYDASAVRSDLTPERALSAAYYDEKQGVWIEVPCTIDKATQQIVVGTNHLTIWGWFMKKVGYGILQDDTFVMAWDDAEINDPATGPSYTPVDRSNHKDPKIPDYVEDAFAYLGTAYQRYKAAGFSQPWTPINVYVGGGDPSQRGKFFGHGLSINLNQMDQPQLKMETAHECFHSFEGAYLTAVGMGTGELPVVGWAPPILSWSVWYIESAAEYAAEHVAWEGTLHKMGSKLRKDFLSYPLYDVSETHHDYGYATAHFLKYLTDNGAVFRPMSVYLFGYDWTNLNDYYYPMSEYLQGKLGVGNGLPRQYQAFARYFVFDANSPMPAIADTLHSEVAAYKSTLAGTSGDNATFDLPAGYTAKLWGIHFSDSLFSTTEPKRKYTVSVSGALPAKVVADVYVLKGDRRMAGGTSPAGTLTQTTASVPVEVEKGDAVYVLAVSTDSTAAGKVKVSIAGPAPSAYMVHASYDDRQCKISVWADGTVIFSPVGMFLPQWNGNSFTYSSEDNESRDYGTTLYTKTSVSGTLSADQKSLDTFSADVYARQTFPVGTQCKGTCLYETWVSVALDHIPAASDWTSSYLHYQITGASARPKITKLVWRARTSGWPDTRDNWDCTLPIDESKPEDLSAEVFVSK